MAYNLLGCEQGRGESKHRRPRGGALFDTGHSHLRPATIGGGQGDHQRQNHANEQLGAIIALLWGIGGATYMKCGRSLAHGLHPIFLSFFINVGMCCITFMLCLGSMELELSTSISRGIFGFVNPISNPPAILHSLFPDGRSLFNSVEERCSLLF